MGSRPSPGLGQLQRRTYRMRAESPQGSARPGREQAPDRRTGQGRHLLRQPGAARRLGRVRQDLDHGGEERLLHSPRVRGSRAHRDAGVQQAGRRRARGACREVLQARGPGAGDGGGFHLPCLGPEHHRQGNGKETFRPRLGERFRERLPQADRHRRAFEGELARLSAALGFISLCFREGPCPSGRARQGGRLGRSRQGQEPHRRWRSGQEPGGGHDRRLAFL